MKILLNGNIVSKKSWQQIASPNLHWAQEGVFRVVLVKIFEEIANGCECENEGVEFEEEPALFGWKFPSIPELSLPGFDTLSSNGILRIMGYIFDINPF